MATAYLSCSLGGIKVIERKFFVTIQDFLQRQHHYQVEYKKLHPTENVIEITYGGFLPCQDTKRFLVLSPFMPCPLLHQYPSRVSMNYPICMYSNMSLIVPEETSKHGMVVLPRLSRKRFRITVAYVISSTSIHQKNTMNSASPSMSLSTSRPSRKTATTSVILSAFSNNSIRFQGDVKISESTLVHFDYMWSERFLFTLISDKPASLNKIEEAHQE